MALASTGGSAEAQGRDTAGDGHRTAVWVSGGVGSGAVAGDGAMAVAGQVVGQLRRHHVVLRASGMGNVVGDASADDVGEVAILYGRGVTRGWGHAMVATGVARVGGTVCDADGCDRDPAVGLPLLAEAAWEIGPVVGLGLQAFADVNEKASFGGLAVLLRLGWMP